MASAITQPFIDNPLNIAMLLPIAYLFYSIALPNISPKKEVPSEWREGYSWRPKSHPPTILFRRYSPKTLQKFNGTDDERILLAIDRKVFDVTMGKSFYGPGGPYGNFAGRDASRGMAKQSFDEEMLTPVDGPIDTLEGLTRDEIENMESWIMHFSNKYIVCGELVENNEL